MNHKVLETNPYFISISLLNRRYPLPMKQDESKLIDWKQIGRLQNDVGHESFEEIVGFFLQEVEVIFARMQNQPHCRQLENKLHALKGSALNLGFFTLSNLCEEGEELAAHGKASEVDLSKIFKCFQTSKSQFSIDLPKTIMDER